MEDISPELFEGFAQSYINKIVKDHEIITDIYQDSTCIILTTNTKKIIFCKCIRNNIYILHIIYFIDKKELYRCYDNKYNYLVANLNMSESDIINTQTDCNLAILEKIENNILYFLHVDLDYEVETRVMVPYNS